MHNRFLVIVAVLAAATGLSACGGSSSQSAQNGKAIILLAVPQTGTGAQLGRDMLEAARMVLDANRGKAGDVKVELAKAVDEADPTQGPDPEVVTRSAAAAVANEQVVGWIGGFDSNDTALQLPILNSGGVTAVSPAATATPLTSSDPEFPGAPAKYFPQLELYGRNFVRTVAKDEQISIAALRELKRAGVRSIYAFDAGDTDGVAFSSALERTASSAGIKFAGHDSVEPKLDDWSNELDAVREAGADAVAWGSVPGSGESALWQQASAVSGIKQMVAGPAVGADTVRRLGGVRSGTLWFSAVIPDSVGGSSSQKFASAFKRRTGRAALPGAIDAAAAMEVLIAAIAKASKSYGPAAGGGSLRSAVATAVHSIRSVDSMNLKFDALGDRVDAPVGSWSASGGRLVFGGVTK
jgi:ABC-type branched-subunit amino acid transport system substrate-binding protein